MRNRRLQIKKWRVFVRRRKLFLPIFTFTESRSKTVTEALADWANLIHGVKASELEPGVYPIAVEGTEPCPPVLELSVSFDYDMPKTEDVIVFHGVHIEKGLVYYTGNPENPWDADIKAAERQYVSSANLVYPHYVPDKVVAIKPMEVRLFVKGTLPKPKTTPWKG